MRHIQGYFLIGNFYRATILNVNISLYKTLDERNCKDNNGIEPFANRRNLNLCQVCNVLYIFHLEYRLFLRAWDYYIFHTDE